MTIWKAPMEDVRRPFGAPDAGLAQVMIGSTDELSGMAFLVAPKLAVTCAHVVNVALGRDKYDRSPLPCDAVVSVRFPLADDISHTDGSYDLPERSAKIMRFKPPGRLPTDDIALLALNEEAPVEVGETVLADIRGVALDRDELGVFGPATDPRLIVHFDALFAGRVNPSWSQIEAASKGEDFVAGGFSGGRVWSYTHDAAIGMVVAVPVSDSHRRAFMIPAASIRSFFSSIPSEVRAVGRNFCLTWTVFASCFLVILLTHFLGERIRDYPLAFWGGNTVVNGFYGLNINAVLMPIVLTMLLRFSAGYSQHPWWNRLPQFGRFERPARPSASRTAAILTLIFFVVAPLYIQGHFLRSLHSQGEVYIYPEQFGFNADDLEKQGQRCFRPSVHYCTHDEAGLYSTVTPKPGYRGGYIENAYHYGNRSLGPIHSVTFFPILQPLLIWVLYLGSIAIAGWLGVRVFSAPSRRWTELEDPVIHTSSDS